MFKSITTFLAGLLTALPLFAQCTPADLRASLTKDERSAIARDAAATPYGVGRAFRATRGGDELVLFGTFHSAAAGGLPTGLTDEMPLAAQVLIEVTSDQNAYLQTQMQTDPTLILDIGGAGLQSQLPAQEWASLTSALRPLGMPPEVVDMLQPWFAATMITLPQCELTHQASGAQTIDATIEALALSQGIPVQGLETALEALASMQNLPTQTQIDFLRIGLGTIDTAEPLFMTMAQLYSEGRIAEINELTNAISARATPMAEVDALSEQVFGALLGGRNHNWMPAILDAAQHGPSIVAVGALHLGGDEGLLRLLEGEGFDITRIVLDGEVSE